VRHAISGVPCGESGFYPKFESSYLRQSRPTGKSDDEAVVEQSTLQCLWSRQQKQQKRGPWTSDVVSQNHQILVVSGGMRDDGREHDIPVTDN